VVNPKEELRSRMALRDRKYPETVDQAPMSALVDLDKVARSCRSMRKLLSAMAVLVEGLDRTTG